MANFAPKIRFVSREFAAVILVYAAMMNHFFLMPQLSAAPISTLIWMLYSLILSTAVVLSASVYFNGTVDKPPKQLNDLLRFIGYGLFFFSDSLLLLCVVGAKVPYHHVLVLSTYFTSQYLILIGATNQLRLIENMKMKKKKKP
uniref:Uncharacterized protein n=1 Tax=Panagrolaimus sp. JU765 TaxID=591449 RepID=A0AC34QHE9_9BILA